ncbi:MAG: hypothetical protein ACFCD0_27070 [Gemmataceae bacterium]
MFHRGRVTLLVSVLVGLCSPGLVHGQASANKPVVAQGKVRIGLTKQKLEAEKLYAIQGTASCNMTVQVYDSKREQLGFGDSRHIGKDHKAIVYLVPKTTQDHTVVLIPSTYIEKLSDNGEFDYAIGIVPVSLKVAKTIEDKLTKKDRPFETLSYHKSYTLKLKGGHVYQFDMKSDKLPCSLYLVDQDGITVLSNSGTEKAKDARLVFACPENAKYRIKACTRLPDNVGPYTLTVQEGKAPADVTAGKEKEK